VHRFETRDGLVVVAFLRKGVVEMVEIAREGAARELRRIGPLAAARDAPPWLGGEAHLDRRARTLVAVVACEIVQANRAHVR